MEEQELTTYLFKVMTLGDIGVGKTYIITRFVHNTLYNYHLSGPGVNFALKVINWDSNTVVRLQFWDVAAHNMTRVYYRDAGACVIVADPTQIKTVKAIDQWLNDFKRNLIAKLPEEQQESFPIVIALSKCDEASRDLLRTGIQAWFGLLVKGYRRKTTVNPRKWRRWGSDQSNADSRSTPL